MTPEADRVVVIGGGVAGIAAAVRLVEAGRSPVLIEARRYLGGRLRSFRHVPTGDEIDNGQHLLMGCYRATSHLLESLGTWHLIGIQERLDVSFRDADGRTDRLLASTRLPAPFNVVSGMMRLARLSRADRVRLLRVALLVRAGGARDGESVAELLARAGQSPEARRRLWDPLAIATMNARPEEAPASVFVQVMRRAFLGDSLDSRLAIPRVPLSDLLIPAHALIEASGGEVITGATVLSVERQGRGFVVAHCRGTIAASGIVCAAPPKAAARLLSPLGVPLQHWGELEGSPIVSLYLWFDRSLSTIPEVTAMIGTSVQWVFNRRRTLRSPHATPGLLACTISAAAAESSQDSAALIRKCEIELRRAFPEIPQEARLLDSMVIKERHATYLSSPTGESNRPRSLTTVPRLALAGDWTATGLPATIEGAAQSGFEAAGILLTQMRNGEL